MGVLESVWGCRNSDAGFGEGTQELVWRCGSGFGGAEIGVGMLELSQCGDAGIGVGMQELLWGCRNCYGNTGRRLLARCPPSVPASPNAAPGRALGAAPPSLPIPNTLRAPWTRAGRMESGSIPHPGLSLDKSRRKQPPGHREGAGIEEGLTPSCLRVLRALEELELMKPRALPFKRFCGLITTIASGMATLLFSSARKRGEKSSWSSLGIAHSSLPGLSRIPSIPAAPGHWEWHRRRALVATGFELPPQQEPCQGLRRARSAQG